VEYKVYSDLINTDTIMQGTFWMGCHPGPADTHINYLIESIHRFVSGKL
jgi:CDP-6-deoxy-D-xylo-4-hexulose-3-dehydrase